MTTDCSWKDEEEEYRSTPRLVPGVSSESNAFQNLRETKREIQGDIGECDAFHMALAWQCGHGKEAVILELTETALDIVTDWHLVVAMNWW